MFGLDPVEVEWFTSEDEIGLVGVWVERFGGAVYDEVFGLVYSGKCWAWGGWWGLERKNLWWLPSPWRLHLVFVGPDCL